MSFNIDELKKKIIYRSNYRGTKEMDKLLGKFVKKYINNFEKKNIFHVFFGENDLKIKSKLKCYDNQKQIGEITSIIFSPKFKKNMGFMIAYEKDTSNDKSKKYFVNTEQGLIQATILNLS